MYLSKSRYIDYKQCPKKLWLNIYHRELADEMDQSVFINGNKVGELARNLFPGGTLVEYNHKDRHNIANMVKKTKELLESDIKVIYEAAFLRDNYLVICDILVKTKRGFDIYEVKSSTSLKEVYEQDVTFQYWVITSLGYKINHIYVTYINNQYIRQGKLDINKLFISKDITKRATQFIEEIDEDIQNITKIIEGDAPNTDIGLYCNNPYTCQFKSYCFKHIPKYSVFEIRNMNAKRKFELYYQDILTFKDVRSNHVNIPQSQMIQLDSRLDDVKIINKNNIKQFLNELYYPLYFLDFETFSSPIPLFDENKPYQQIPSQYSLHYISEQNTLLEHKEFLAKEGIDPRYELATRLIEDIPSNACVLAYNMSFEKRVISELANMYSDLDKQLMTIHNNIKDLMIPFRKKDYYIKEMKGSYSIKQVLPALFPNDEQLKYENLKGVHEGQEAANAYLSLTDLDITTREQIREDLLRYCELDTLAMVKIWEKLLSIVK